MNGAVGVEMAAPLVGGKGIAKETNIEDTEEAGKGGGQGLEVVVQEVGGRAKMSGAGKLGDGRRSRGRFGERWTWERGENAKRSLC